MTQYISIRRCKANGNLFVYTKNTDGCYFVIVKSIMDIAKAIKFEDKQSANKVIEDAESGEWQHHLEYLKTGYGLVTNPKGTMDNRVMPFSEGVDYLVTSNKNLMEQRYLIKGIFNF